MSSEFQDAMKKYGVHHRVSSVGFPHGNCRAEVAVKTAKRLLRAHISPTGTLDTVEITKALLQYRNTPDRDTGISPAQMLYNRKLPDFLPSKPVENIVPKHDNLSDLWKNTAEWRELALARRSQRIHEKLSEHTKDLKPLSVGDNVLVQNLLGNNPKRWDKRGVILEVLPHRQYKVRMDGSRRISLRNRKHLRKFEPLIGEKKFVLPTQAPKGIIEEAVVPAPINDVIQNYPREIVNDQAPLPQLIPPAREYSDTHVTPQRPTRMAPGFTTSPVSPPCMDGTPSTPEAFYTPEVQSQTVAPAPSVLPTVQSTPTILVAPQLPTTPVTVNNPALPRRSSRMNKGQTSRFQDYATGGEYDTATESSQILYAMQLPPGFEQVSALWNGYQWIQWVQPWAA